MRVLQVTSTYYPEFQFGGPPQKIHAFSRGLEMRSHDVRVITFHSALSKTRRQDIFDGVKVEYVPWVGRGVWRIPLDFLLIRENVQWAQVVHGYGLYNLLCPAAAFFASQMRRPFLLEPLGMYLPRLGQVRAKLLYHRLFTNPMSRMAARVIATSPAEAEQLAGLVDDGHLVLRRNIIDLDPFRQLTDRTVFRTTHEIGEDERIILFIGRISPVKNLEQLLQAFHQAMLERARLVLVGPMLEPDYAERLKSLVASLGLTARVLMVGPLYGQEKLAALSAADLFVLPSISESFGNAAAEAVAAGVPVLLTETCGIAPLIHGRAGLAVPQTTSALAEGLRTMLDNADKRAELTRLRDDVLKELSWDEPLRQTELLYEQVCRDSHTALRPAELQI